MEYSIRLSENHSYVELKIVGDFTATEMLRLVAESHSFGKSNDVHNYLVDSLSARNIDSAMGNYQFAYKDMPEVEEVDPLARVAVLVSPDDHSHDFIETVAFNTGSTLKIFRSFNEAINFLDQ